MDVRVISIGALEAHPLWNERVPVRTGHATTTLIRTADRTILVDPGLPPTALAARLGERAGVTPDKVTDVFFTCFKPATTRGARAFSHARFWIHENEREGVGVPLATELRRAAEEGEQDLVEALERDVQILKECRAAPDKFAEQVDLFPLFGVTPGCCGLLIAEPMRTTVVCGDAVPTVEHLEKGMVLKSAVDVEAARESLHEAVEIADVLILGRDNVVYNPTKRPF